MTLQEFLQMRSVIVEEPQSAPIIVVRDGSCSRDRGSRRVARAWEEWLAQAGVAARLIRAGCRGPCHLDVMVHIMLPQGPSATYGRVTPKMVPRLGEEHVLKGKPVTEYAVDGEWEEWSRLQIPVLTARCGFVEPHDTRDYVRGGGYEALTRLLQMTPEERAEAVAAASDGWGGVPFRQALQCLAEVNGKRCLVASCAGGDPTAAAARVLLEGDPHALIEGMLVAGLLTGATRGVVVCGPDQGLARERLSRALSDASGYSLLGDGILGGDFGFRLEVVDGPTALVDWQIHRLARVAGGPDGLKPDPLEVARSGYLVAGVEAYLRLSQVLAGGESRGRERGGATRLYYLKGEIARPGLVEVPADMPVRDVIYEIGGGTGSGPVKAVFAGGCTGSFLRPAELQDPGEQLCGEGAALGDASTVVVLGEGACIPYWVWLVSTFLVQQANHCRSCQGCEPLRRVQAALDKLVTGRAQESDLDVFAELAVGGGQTVPECPLATRMCQPAASAWARFRHEFLEHVRGHRCRSSMCQEMFPSSCSNACPAGVDNGGAYALALAGRYRDALALLRFYNPLVVVCGRVCEDPPCEQVCRRRQMEGEPVSIRALHRFIAECAAQQAGDLKRALARPPRVVTRGGKKVAVVGAGPAGLAAAYFLSLYGRQVTVFEARDVPGGMMMAGIPTYRLPREVLQAEVEDILRTVDVRYGVRVGQDLTLDQLLEEYEAVFLAVGAQASVRLGIPGEDVPGVYPGVEFLRALHAGHPYPVGERVAVIGGGNVAIDAARCALRLGAREVKVLYRRQKGDMPACVTEIEAAEQEGIIVVPLMAPAEILHEGGRVAAVRCLVMRPGPYDGSGRRTPVPQDGEGVLVPADTVIVAVGQVPDLRGLVPDAGLESRHGTLVVDPFTMATNRPRVYAGGDCVTGPATVVEAVGAGRRAARAIEQLLGGDPDRKEEAVRAGLRALSGLVAPPGTPATRPGLLDAAARKKGFEEVELALEAKAARREMTRCLCATKCGL